MSLLPEHASLVELTKQLRELGVTSFKVGETAVQLGPLPTPEMVAAERIPVRAVRPSRPMSEDDKRAAIESQRQRELSRV